MSVACTVYIVAKRCVLLKNCLKKQIGNDLWWIEWSRDRWRHVMLKGQTRDSNTCRAQYLENSWRCCLVTVANVCEKVWSGAMNHGSARLGSTTHIRGLAPMIHLIKFSSCIGQMGFVSKLWVLEPCCLGGVRLLLIFHLLCVFVVLDSVVLARTIGAWRSLV